MIERRGHGSGKLILLGEHAVVHGQPALAFAVDRGTDVVLTPRVDGVRRVLGDVRDPLLDEALASVLPDGGWDVAIASSLPLGRGMGSSASLGVAVSRAVLGPHAAPDAVFTHAMRLETVFHANPSGLDVAVSVRGGLLRYQRSPAPVFESLPCPTWSVVVLDSGSKGSTREMVQGVASRRPSIDAELAAIGSLVTAALRHLDDPVSLGPLLNENHDRLRAIGVSTPRLDALCELARGAGAHGAKLSGAGGGGVVLALVTDPAPVLAAADKAGIPAFVTTPAASRT
ncbi:MAG: hypothetical protein RLZZ383_630 [Pseudomonadota bacterium]